MPCVLKITSIDVSLTVLQSSPKTSFAPKGSVSLPVQIKKAASHNSNYTKKTGRNFSSLTCSHTLSFLFRQRRPLIITFCFHFLGANVQRNAYLQISLDIFTLSLDKTEIFPNSHFSLNVKGRFEFCYWSLSFKMCSLWLFEASSYTVAPQQMQACSRTNMTLTLKPAWQPNLSF